MAHKETADKPVRLYGRTRVKLKTASKKSGVPMAEIVDRLTIYL